VIAVVGGMVVASPGPDVVVGRWSIPARQGFPAGTTTNWATQARVEPAELSHLGPTWSAEGSLWKEDIVGPYPVRVSARPERCSRWLWLVKWLLLVPHYLVLAVLWVAFVVLTAVAYLSVLFTGRYPRAVFGFNVGVLRWTWRVGYYGYWVLGTDRYPPFTLADVPEYPARLDIDGPPAPKRWLPLVAWLFALPHILIAAALTAGLSWDTDGQDATRYTAPGVAGIVVLIVGLALLFTGRRPAGLYDLLVGAWRWYLRVGAYVALLTDRYPPFRLELGGDEPDGPGPDPSGTAAVQPRAAAPRTTGGVLALVVGVLLFLTGGGLGIGGGVLLGLSADRDDGGFITGDRVSVASTTAAVTVEDIEIHPGSVYGREVTGLDQVRVTVTGPQERPLFLGVARQSDVDAWLRGTAHDQVSGFYNRVGVRYERASGVARAVEPPTSQLFWLASATGTGAVTLNWTPGDGAFALVLANADGTPGVTADATVAAKIPVLRPVGVGLLGVGLTLLAVAAALIYLGAATLGGGTRGTTGGNSPDGPPGSGPPVATGPPLMTVGG
jgi:hypothetical protein